VKGIFVDDSLARIAAEIFVPLRFSFFLKAGSDQRKLSRFFRKTNRNKQNWSGKTE
jgi:hypothetical protein